jgi:WD40 repeat protein
MRLLAFTLFFLLCTRVHSQTDESQIPEDLAPISVETISTLEGISGVDAQYQINDFEWSANGEILIIGTRENVWEYHLITGELHELLYGNMAGIRFIENSSHIAMYDNSELVISIYDLEASLPVRHIFVSGSVSISPSGTMYATGGWEAAEIYALESGELLHTFEVNRRPECEYACAISTLAFSRDESLFVYGAAVADVESAIINLNTGEKITGANFGSGNLVFSPDASMIAADWGTPGYIPTQLLLTNSQTGENLVTLGLAVSTIAFNNSGDLFAVGVWDTNAPNPDEARGFVYFYAVQDLLEVDNPEPIFMMNTSRPPLSMEFSPNDELLAISSWDWHFGIWAVPEDAE